MAPRLQLAATPPPPTPRFDAETARRFLSYILDTEAGVCEIRVFRAHLDFKSGYAVPSHNLSSTLTGWYNRIHDIIVDLGKLRGVSAYITINPVNPDLFARCANELGKSRNATSDADIVCFRWLYIDIDPKRPADISSTDEELALAVAKRDCILEEHPALAEHAIWGKSGNGAWILVLLPDYLPEEGHDLAVQALNWISARYSDDAVKIDVATKNPSRVGVIPGTVKCKGSNISERPHRLATLESPHHDEDNPLMPCDLRAWIEAVGADQPIVAPATPGTIPLKGKAKKRPGKDNEAASNQPEPQNNGAGIYYPETGISVFDDFDQKTTWDDLLVQYGWRKDSTRPDGEIYWTRPGKTGGPSASTGYKGADIFHVWTNEGAPFTPDETYTKGQAYALLNHDGDMAACAKELASQGYGTWKAEDGSEHPNPVPDDWRNIRRDGRIGDHANGHVNGAVVPQPPTAGKLNPRVEVTPVEIGVNNQVCNLLHRSKELFQRNHRLVEIARRPKDEARKRVGMIPAGTPTIVNIEGPRLREIISEVVTFVDQKGKPLHVPEWCVSALNHRNYWEGVPVLTSVVEHPSLRPDGSMLERDGYDPETGIFWISDEPFEPLVERPSQADAEEAAKRLMGLIAEFPFQGKSHRAAWLAALLTILNRHLIDDAVPLFLFEATVSGSGKTLLCDLISRIVTGRDMVRSSYYHDAIEMDKQIVATALGGIRVTMLDNVEGAFGNSSLDNALTGRWYRGRILGQSSMTTPLLLDTVFMATGNNISFHGDIFRRIVPCRLESPYERPDKDKTKFQIADIRAHVVENRVGLIRDALTIMRAYIQADCPHSLPLNVYGAWTRLIRGAVVWATGIDPMEGQKELAEADMARMSRASFVDGFVQMIRHLGRYEITAGEILANLQSDIYADRFHVLRDAISGLWPKGGLPSLGSLGKRMMSMRGSRSGNFRLMKVGMAKHTATWGVEHWDSDTEQWSPINDWSVIKSSDDCDHAINIFPADSTDSVNIHYDFEGQNS